MNIDKYAELRAAIDAVEFHDDGHTKWQIYHPKEWELAANPEAIRALLAERDALIDQHHRDSAEMRSLCAARDGARRVAREAVAGFGSSHERNTKLTLSVLALRETLTAIANTETRPGDEKADALLASVINVANAALAQEGS